MINQKTTARRTLGAHSSKKMDNIIPIICVLIASLISIILYSIKRIDSKIDKLCNHLSDFQILKKQCPLLK